MKLIYFVIIFCIFVVLILFFYRKHVADSRNIMTINECIYNSPYIQKMELLSKRNIVFKIHYISNSPSNSINPNFPSIHITASGNHNAWIQIITTDSKDLNYKRYIDTNERSFPFYSLDRDFYDAPLWGSYFANNSIKLWRGHVYPVIVDCNNQIVILKAGIKWGFELRNFMNPKMITPQNLTTSELMEDLTFLQKKISVLNFIYGV